VFPFGAGFGTARVPQKQKRLNHQDSAALSVESVNFGLVGWVAKKAVCAASALRRARSASARSRAIRSPSIPDSWVVVHVTGVRCDPNFIMPWGKRKMIKHRSGLVTYGATIRIMVGIYR